VCEACIQAATEITKAMVEQVSDWSAWTGTGGAGPEIASKVGKGIGMLYKEIYAAISEASGCKTGNPEKGVYVG